MKNTTERVNLKITDLGSVVNDHNEVCPICKSERGLMSLVTLYKMSVRGASWLIGWCSFHKHEVIQEKV